MLSTEKRGLPETKTRLFDEFRARYAFTYEQLPRRNEPWLRAAVALRHALDYLRYLEPEFAHADPLRARARERAPWLIRMLVAVPLVRGPAGRGALGAVLRRLEAAVPVPRAFKALIEAHRPDVVLVSPLVGMGSTESEFIRAAEELHVPTVLPVSSWDNLTNKGVLRDVPTTTIVWNEAQVEEAVRLHGLPREQVAVVGAHTFDHWFGRSPSSTRNEFARERGLDPERPLLLYSAAGAGSIKIDQSFVRALATDPRSAAVVEAVVALGHRLGLEVVAEGIEDEATAHRLLASGCDRGQGYLFGRAGAADVVLPEAGEQRDDQPEAVGRATGTDGRASERRRSTAPPPPHPRSARRPRGRWGPRC